MRSALSTHAAQVAPPLQHVGEAQSEALLEALRIVDRLQRENRDLAGLVGSLQQRLVFADERIRMLEAPKEVTPSEIASSGPTATFGVEVTKGEPARPKRRGWWRFWTA